MKTQLWCAVALLGMAGCSGSPGMPAPTPTATSRTIGPTIALYPGHGPATSPPSGVPAANSENLVFRSAASSQSSGVTGAQYLVDEPGYAGTFSFASSCASQSVATASFENGIVIGNPPSSYSESPGPTGTGPAALFDVVSSGIFGPHTCLLSINDAQGHSATIQITNDQLLLYQADPGPTPRPGASGTPFALLANFSPTTFLVYEQGYSGAYTLDPSSCTEFSARLTPGTMPSSGAILTLSEAAAPNGDVCTFVVRDADGQIASAEAYYEGV